MTSRDFPLVHLVHDLARPLSDPHTQDELVAAMGDARVVLLGEATHGTHEFYAERAQLTERLIVEKGFHAVVVEADAADAHRVNRFVRGADDVPNAEDALSGFRRFPGWVWRNEDVLAFVRWLRTENDRLPSGAPRAGFHGLDVYGLDASMEAALWYLQAVDPDGARVLRERHRRFDDFSGHVEGYEDLASIGGIVAHEDAVVARLVARLERVARDAGRDGDDAEQAFHAGQYARFARSAETYYRTMFRGDVESWNLRERHLAETLEEVLSHLDQRFGRGKVVLWEHNSHAGDARASDLGRRRGQLNVGQLVRERLGRDAFIVGFTTHSGTLTAASTWGGPAERKRVRPALSGSYEALFHRLDIPRFALDLRDLGEAARGLHEPRVERAIGVVYRPSDERRSHYVEATLPDQFDAVIHLDETSAVEPLERLADAGGSSFPLEVP